MKAQSVGVGFHLVDLPQGNSMVSNPFQSGSNLVSDLFIEVPDGFSVSKLVDGVWIANAWSADSSTWSNPLMSLTPGEGARIDSPEAYQWFTFGKPLVGSLNNFIPQGESARGSRLAAGGLISADLGFNPPSGTTVGGINPDGTVENPAIFVDGLWLPAEPIISVGQAVIINSPEAVDWEQNFAVEGIENPLSFAQQPGDLALVEGGALTLSAEAVGAENITYQWQLNGNDISGATGSVLTIDAVSLADAGQFAVLASTTDASLRSSFANVSVDPVVVEPTEGPSLSVALDEVARRVNFVVTGNIGEVYTIEATDDFENWSRRASDLVNETGTVTHTERIAPRRHRIFRAVIQN
ncbi:MAG: hypothetical protein ISQ73_11745 [Verrucomicrobiae bacterium]|nr:hypothetical protein [Verrucomicrobiae bacterium]